MGKLSNLVLFLLSLFIFARTQCCFCTTTNFTAGCVQEERDALQKFKESLSDRSGRLSSWRGYNCCKWRGVFCNATTGHVVKLDLRPANFTYYYLTGSEVNPSLMGLTYLNYLDLSGINFQFSPIPAFLGSMTHLTYLNLSHAGFSGIVPRNLGNLSSLVVLDLRFAGYLEVDDIMWVSQLSSLQHLDLSYVDLSRAKNLGKVLNMLPALVKVRLAKCQLTNSHLSHAYANSSLANVQFLDLSANLLEGEIPQLLLNMTCLRTLDLSSNKLNSSADHSLFPMIFWNNCHLETLDMSDNGYVGELLGFTGNLSNCLGYSLVALRLRGNRFTGLLPDNRARLLLLKYLDLSWNLLSGSIPTSLGKLSNLEELDLSYNHLSGSIPPSLGTLTSLKLLYLSQNQLNGTIPTTLGNLFNLEELHLSSNHLSGVISEAHFSKMAMLKVLRVGYNFLTFKLRSYWKPPFQLQKVFINSCPLQSEFPQWLQTQKEVTELDLSNTSMSGTLPEWLHYLNLTKLNLSGNLFSGPLPHNISEMMPGLTSFLLRENHLNGAIPNSLCKIGTLQVLDLSKNSLSGNIPNCWNDLQKLFVLKLSSNGLSGIIPNSIGSINLLYALDLSENNLIGNIPDNFGSLITVLKLSSNRLSGIIPNSIGLRCGLKWLHLNNNSLSGEIPYALRNCSNLLLLDVGDNGLTGELPKWIGEDLKHLQALRLHNNNFTGPIPLELCLLSQLQIMDLGYNHLTGNIPHCFGNLSGMTSHYSHDIRWIEESMSLVLKGLEQVYTRTLVFAVDMDLSNNKLVGKIPEELTNLSILVGLNLSNNYLTGRIPGSIGNMKSLESLDLSNNDLSAEIPRGISDLKFLSHLNLSYNNFSGQIPTGTQLQTLNDPSVYAGNRELCGAPLLKKCKSDRPTHESPAAKNHDERDDGDRTDELVLFYGDVLAGFATGFWGVLAILVFKRSWRQAFFNFLETVKDRILLEISLRARKFPSG